MRKKIKRHPDRGQRRLEFFVPKPVIPWEEKLKTRPQPGTPAYMEWWSELTQEQQEMELELKERERSSEVSH